MRAAAAFVADLHLAGDPEDTAALLAFLEAQAGPDGADTLYILGDLFDLWLGSPKLQLDFQREVVRGIERLREAGVQVKFVEGNREFRVVRTFGSLFTAATEDAFDDEVAGLRLHVAHGDRVNTDDRLYRLWRRVSKNRPTFLLFDLLPRRAGLALALALERRLRGTNRSMKRYFPEAHCRRYAEARVAAGTDLLLFGHFHVERRLPIEAGARRGEVVCLPDWRTSRRYLRLDRDGRAEIVPFTM
ncbi:MAG TPA: metallophosphoesterase [Thermodesulfobacteriota bacterium]